MKIEKRFKWHHILVYLLGVLVLTFLFIILASFLGYYLNWFSQESFVQVLTNNLDIDNLSKLFLFFLVIMIPVLVLLFKKTKPIKGLIIICLILFALTFLFFLMGSLFGIQWKSISIMSALLGIMPIIFYLIIKLGNKVIKEIWKDK